MIWYIEDHEKGDNDRLPLIMCRFARSGLSAYPPDEGAEIDEPAVLAPLRCRSVGGNRPGSCRPDPNAYCACSTGFSSTLMIVVQLELARIGEDILLDRYSPERSA